VIQIDIDADLNMVDDEDRNVARRPAHASTLKVGDVAVAGRPGFWSWVMIEEMTDISVSFRQITAQEAATVRGDLSVAARV
jgi:hypothetical protein